MDKLPRRGPRVMHGAGAMLSQARDLGQELARAYEQPVPPSREQIDAEARQTANDLGAVATAFRQLANVEKVLTAFRAQCQQQPEGAPERVLVEKVLQTFQESLDAAIK